MDEEFYEYLLKEEEFDDYTIKNEDMHKNLSRVNLFVGQNNSGKSRFMRKLFSHSNFDTNESYVDLNDLNKKIKEISILLERALEESKITEVQSPIRFSKGVIDDSLKEVKSLEFVNGKSKTIEKLSGFLGGLASIEEITNFEYHGQAQKQYLLNAFRTIEKDYFPSINSLNRLYFSKTKFVYIPILRGLRTLSPGADMFSERTERDYFSEKTETGGLTITLNKKNRIIFSGQKLYEEIKNNLLGSPENRDKIRKYEKFLSDRIFKEDIALVPRVGSDVLYVRIGKEKERPIYELGDGIQSLIILTFPLFIYDKAVFFIEEPEFMIHPGLQRKFMEVVTLNSDKDHQYFMTTHSNHFLDLSLDYKSISIYSFKKQEEKFVIECLSPGDRSLLLDLGVYNSSVFLSNCTIWVEGITDRLYIKKFLELYFKKNEKEFEEDIHYSFVEYGGNNITHWSFLDEGEEDKITASRMSGKAFVIVDKDEGRKEERKTKLKGMLKDNYLELPCEETENLLPPEILKSILKDYETGIKNEEINNFEYNDYKDIRLGNFISEKAFIEGYTIKRKGGYKEDSGTLKSKKTFCEKALNLLDDYSKLTDNAKELIEKIIVFIKKNNP